MGIRTLIHSVFDLIRLLSDSQFKVLTVGNGTAKRLWKELNAEMQPAVGRVKREWKTSEGGFA